ncbi:MAG: type IIL restriction-modification enzyme MmeI [Lacipirellulaceae bacterium]
MDAAQFVARWGKSAASERSNYQSFLIELCDLLGVPRPEPAVEDNQQNAHVFERAVRFDNLDGTHSTGYADLYNRGAFVCETKQGVEADDQRELLSTAQQTAAKAKKKGHGTRGSKGYDDTMRRAAGQAQQYARALPADEGRPPFVLVVDVGHSIELYSEFSQTGGAYVPFPDPENGAQAPCRRLESGRGAGQHAR